MAWLLCERGSMMLWYGWLILGLLLAVCITLAIVSIYLWYRQRNTNVGLSADEQIKLLNLSRESDQKKAQIEQEKTAMLQRVAVRLQATLDELKLAHDKRLAELDEDGKKEFNRLRANADLCSIELDKILGVPSSRPDDTDRR
ncbi:hypothetical protein MUP59_02750 [Candidatus Bathyarchaeota archaeon]|nr:hypothetical protein [Candidatus Bathyarchaeota archaeon]